MIIYLAVTTFFISSFNGVYKQTIHEFELPEERNDLEYYAMIPDEYKSICAGIKQYTGIPYKIIFNLVQHESGWEEKAYNGSNSNGSYDIGLTQINSNNFEYFYWKIMKLNPESNLNYKAYYSKPDISLWAGFLYLQYLIDYYDGDILRSLQAYNCGMGRVNSNRIPERTKEYVSFILTN